MHALAVSISVVSALAHSAGAYALPVAGQGTWETTLQARDLNGDSVTDAYYDTSLNITWLANANKNGAMSWTDAKSWAGSLEVFGFVGWRLPDTLPVGSTFGPADFAVGGTASEMGHLFFLTLGNCATAGGGPHPCVGQTSAGLSNTGPFIGLQTPQYWSRTAYAPIPDYAFVFNTLHGFQDAEGIRQAFFAMAVRPGDVTGVVPEPQTYALLLTGLAALSMVRRRRGL